MTNRLLRILELRNEAIERKERKKKLSRNIKKQNTMIQKLFISPGPFVEKAPDLYKEILMEKDLKEIKEFLENKKISKDDQKIRWWVEVLNMERKEIREKVIQLSMELIHIEKDNIISISEAVSGEMFQDFIYPYLKRNFDNTKYSSFKEKTKRLFFNLRFSFDTLKEIFRAILKITKEDPEKRREMIALFIKTAIKRGKWRSIINLLTEEFGLNLKEIRDAYEKLKENEQIIIKDRLERLERKN